uniref:Uncharacterized protein n=1 Tax=Arundo donax TaxID=35708 RepID=A0A0A9GW08_ARUDO
MDSLTILAMNWYVSHGNIIIHRSTSRTVACILQGLTDNTVASSCAYESSTAYAFLV